MDFPLISVLVPCWNEEKHLSLCLGSIIANDYPSQKMEILVIDGESTDNTKKIALDLKKSNPIIEVIDNKNKTFPSAVNEGVRRAKGDLIFIMGAHAEYSTQYLSGCVRHMSELNAENVGGALITKAENNSFIGDIITSALTNKFGVGNSSFRTGTSEITEVDTVFGGCYRKEIFAKIGNFNENLVSTSDYEFNKRLRKAGGKIYLIPDLQVIYYTRTNFKKFVRNNFRNGFWAIYPLAFTDYIPVSLRHFIPLLFFLSLVSTLILSAFSSFFLYVLFFIAGIYFLGAIYFSFSSYRLKNFLLPIFFSILHLSYGAGSFVAIMKLFFYKLQGIITK